MGVREDQGQGWVWVWVWRWLCMGLCLYPGVITTGVKVSSPVEVGRTVGRSAGRSVGQVVNRSIGRSSCWSCGWVGGRWVGDESTHAAQHPWHVWQVRHTGEEHTQDTHMTHEAQQRTWLRSQRAAE